MNPLNTDNASITRLAIGGVVAVIVLNLLVRSFVKLGGVLSTLLVAAVVAAGMALWFYLQHKRRPLPSERRRLIAVYGGTLALLYLGLLGMMWLKDEPGAMGLLILGLHYFCYPLFAWLFLAKALGKRSE
jgi:peptidoglycan biosynthesis protein MviN/MurJ (putative lipid II flippase)